MSKYVKYPSYKDSGVEWLGEIPSEWNITKHKYIATFSKGKNPSKLHDDNIEGTRKYLSMDYLRGSADPLYGEIESNSYIVEDSQPLIIWDGSNAGEFVLGVHGILSSTMAASTLLTRSIYNKYYWYVCKTIEPEMRKHSNGMGIPHVNGIELRNINLLHPPRQEQKNIAHYLDIATAKIDTLIEKQTKLIALLKEKRQAVISTAVTRGLDNTVAMKDSGVEWLGEIPEGWTQTPLRYIGRLQNGISKGGDYFGSGFPFVNYGDIYKNGTLPLHVKGLAKSNKEDQHIYSVQIGDVFFTRTSETIDDIGMASTCVKSIETATFSGFTIRFRQLKRVLNENFSKYYFRTGHAQAFFEEQLNLVTRASLGQDILKQLPVLLPPMEEQEVIANYLDDKTSKIDNLISKSTKAIDLLKEKRAALVSSAVTGKIDVKEIA